MRVDGWPKLPFNIAIGSLLESQRLLEQDDMMHVQGYQVGA